MLHIYNGMLCDGEVEAKQRGNKVYFIFIRVAFFSVLASRQFYFRTKCEETYRKNLKY